MNCIPKFGHKTFGVHFIFWDGFKFFWNADPDRGFAPIAGESRIGADFFVLAVWGGTGLRVRIGADRRFAGAD